MADIKPDDLSQDLRNKMQEMQIDVDLTLAILNRYNRGEVSAPDSQEVKLPAPDDPALIDLSESTGDFSVEPADYQRFLDTYGETVKGAKPHPRKDKQGRPCFSQEELNALGKALMPLYAYGVLNGGSATSYSDEIKNREFSPDYFRDAEPLFQKMAELSQNQPKGITPGYINPDGTPGYSFLELKFRALQKLSTGNDQIPFFQMSSTFTEKPLKDAYREYTNSPLLKEELQGKELTVFSAKQPLIAAYTHSREGDKKEIFTRTGGKENAPMALPGGHGQSFMILKKTFQELHSRGIRFVSLGNVDNLGYLPYPEELALLALHGRPAGFEFSWKTPVDVKGGILVYGGDKGLTCADIGPGISLNEVQKAEAQGKPILFNCASGLFNLDYLMEHIDEIIEALPLRFTDRDRESGAYSQAEQVTWEVIGLLERPLIFGVNKFDRFLAAKMLMETLLTSGVPQGKIPGELKGLSDQLKTGLEGILKKSCGLKLQNNRWEP